MAFMRSTMICCLLNGVEQGLDLCRAAGLLDDPGADWIDQGECWRAKCLASHWAVRSNRTSSPLAATSCTPRGNPFAASRSGREIAGTPVSVHMVQKTGLPVDSRPCGAGPVVAGVRMTSWLAKTC